MPESIALVDEPLTVTRRGLLQLFAVFTTAAYAVKEPLFAADLIPSPNASIEVQSNPTKLELFLKSRGIKPAQLARESGYSRMYLLRVRLGRQQPTRECVVHITRACRRLARESVLPRDLFDLQGREEKSILRLYDRIDREERALYEG
jgi:hypothetical protein